MTDEHAYFVDTPWGWKDRLRFKLFPARYCDAPVRPDFQDCVVVRTVAVLDVVDRLRVLWSGALIVETKTVTEHVVGATQTASVAYPTLKRSL